MFKPRFPFVAGQAPVAGPYVLSNLGQKVVHVCPDCKTGGLRFAHEIQYEGCYYRSNEDQGRHAINLCLVDGAAHAERVLHDTHLFAALRIPLYCKECRAAFALVFRVEAKGHLYSTLEAA